MWVQDLPAGWSFELFICVAGMALFHGSYIPICRMFFGDRKEWKVQFWINAWCDVMVTRGFQWWLASVC